MPKKNTTKDESPKLKKEILKNIVKKQQVDKIKQVKAIANAKKIVLDSKSQKSKRDNANKAKNTDVPTKEIGIKAKTSVGVTPKVTKVDDKKSNVIKQLPKTNVGQPLKTTNSNEPSVEKMKNTESNKKTLDKEKSTIKKSSGNKPDVQIKNSLNANKKLKPESMPEENVKKMAADKKVEIPSAKFNNVVEQVQQDKGEKEIKQVKPVSNKSTPAKKGKVDIKTDSKPIKQPKGTSIEPIVENLVLVDSNATKVEDLPPVRVMREQETKHVSKVRYSDEDLDIFRHRITDVRKEALEELSMLKERLEDLTNYDFAEESMIYSMHMAEQGSEAMEKEKTYAQIQRINEYIKKLDEALQRINDKTYGICRVCGCLIAKERLLAVPITTLSASYKIHKRCPEDGVDRIEPLKNGHNEQ